MEGGDGGVSGRLSVVARRKWKHLLKEQIGGGVCHLIMDVVAANLLNYLGITMMFLKSMGVKTVYVLDGGAPTIDNPEEKLIYFTQNNVDCIQKIASQLQQQPQAPGVKIYLVVMPYLDGVGEIILEEMGVYGVASFIPFSIPLFPIDTNTVTTGSDDASLDYMLYNDTSMIPQLAVALNSLTETLGCAYTHTVCIGSTAQEVHILMQYLMEQEGRANQTNEPEASRSKCRLVLFDRRVDMVSALCSQLVYAGMVHDTFGLTCAQCKYKNDEGKEEKLGMTAYNDVVFPRIRDVNFARVPELLHSVVRELGENYKGKETTDLKKLKEFVKTLPDVTEKHRVVAKHMWVASQTVQLRNSDTTSSILEAEGEIVSGLIAQGGVRCMEELMCRPQYPNDALRLMTLIRLTRKVKHEEREKWSRMYMDAFGDDAFIALNVLDELVSHALSSTAFEALRKKFPVVPTDDDSPQVFYGMQPVSSQIIAEALRVKKESELVNTQKRLGTVPISLEYGTRVRPRTENKKEETSMEEDRTIRTRAPLQPLDSYDCVVCFIGGATFSELSHLRYILGPAQTQRTLIVTTGMISGIDIVKKMRA
eukprot:m.44877 g.44877  ORF g.44877 m.44877 type:complete len:593 (-) comp7191_c0_seq1:1213-2991(-)